MLESGLVKAKLDSSATFKHIFYGYGQKSWDTFAFLGHFPIHMCPIPSLTPQTMLDVCIQNFFQVSTLYGLEEGQNNEENFEKVALSQGLLSRIVGAINYFLE